jgi:beta-lactamase regulating signal transducer with metallopeptidase domain
MAKTILHLLLTQAAAGSILTVLQVLVRRLFKRHIRPGLMYAAWLLVALRLLVPLSLSNPLLPSAADRQVPMTKAPAALVQTLVQDTAPAITPVLKQETVAVTPVSMPSPGLTFESLLLLVWSAGVLLTAAYMVMANRRLKKSAGLQPIDMPGSKYPVYLSSLPSPCVLGVFRPVIALTEESMRPENLRYALLHETCHLRRHDLKWGLLRNVLCVLFWFCPFVWLAAAVSRRDCELSCDDAVKRGMCGDERFEYAQTLLRLAGKPIPFAATAMSNRKHDLKERLEYIMGGHICKRSVSVIVSLLLSLTCLFSFATARGASLAPEPTEPTSGLQADALETVLPVDEYTKRAWPMDEINYNDLQVNMDARVKNRQIYECTGTVTALVGRDPQLVTMKLRRDAVYVVLENATGTDWKVGSAYRIFAEAAGKHTDIPKVATNSRVDYLPRLVARYVFKDTGYSVDDLQNKLNDLENKFGSGEASAAVFRDRLGSFDPDDLYMMNFAKALLEVKTAGEYSALLHTHFPGINDSIPGNKPLAQLRVEVDSMFRNYMNEDISKYPWRYEACTAPGVFMIRIGNDSQNIRYEIQILGDRVSYFVTYPNQDEMESQTIPTAEQIPKDAMQTAMDTARKLAEHLFPGVNQSVISFDKEPLSLGQTSGKMLVPFNLLFPGSGVGYRMVVDLDTMRVVQAIFDEMEWDKDRNVVPKVYIGQVFKELDP